MQLGGLGCRLVRPLLLLHPLAGLGCSSSKAMGAASSLPPAPRCLSSSSSSSREAEDSSARWRKTYRIEGEGLKSKCSVSTEDGFHIVSDTPLSMGGGNEAPQPILLLLSALAGCETATAQFVGAGSQPCMPTYDPTLCALAHCLSSSNGTVHLSACALKCLLSALLNKIHVLINRHSSS